MGKKYNSEEEFLTDYDSNKFEKLSLTVDVAVFSVSSEKSDNYRKLTDKFFSVLLIKRDDYPFKGKWCLPGGFVNISESIDDAAKRILFNEANVFNIYIEQLYTFGSVSRDPRMRIISTSYLALIDKNKIDNKINSKAKWFNINYEEKENIIDVKLQSEDEIISYQIKKELRDNSIDRYDYKEIVNHSLAFDHATVITSGIERIKNKLNYTNIAFNLVSEEFALGELQQVYEIILGKKLLDPAFRRIIASKIEATGNYKTGDGHRPSALFRLKK